MTTYADFLATKAQLGGQHGFEPLFLPEWLYDFQSDVVSWALRKGRAGIFGDCGLGKTPMQLVWAQNVVQHTNRPVLILTPLACSRQTVREAEKFSVPCQRHMTGAATIVVTNYERLHLLDANDFAGIVCDESSILKNFDGVTKARVTEFARRLPYRLLCSATPAPNDVIELGTSAEALGEMGYTDMLGTFFKNDEHSIEPMAHGTKWRFRPHAEPVFWKWLCSWARAFRKPSDLGYDDTRFVLPELIIDIDTVEASRPLDGKLFVTPAGNLQDQRQERRLTVTERCERVAERAASNPDAFVAWCHLNDEADLLTKMIPHSRQVKGSQSDSEKEDIFEAFAAGHLKKLITKPKIGAHGLNWQHCHQMSLFPSHSYEQYYQAIRRCWRFGQTQPVTVSVITSAVETNVLGNLQRKSDASDRMFSQLIEHMHHATGPRHRDALDTTIERPSWMETSCSI